MTAVCLFAASTWSSGTSARPPSRKAASFRRRRRSTYRMWRSPIPRTASRHAWASNSWARATTARKCASPSVRELRSMAETEDKQDKRPDKAAPQSGQRPAGGDKPVKAEKAEKTERAERTGKGEKDDKAA